MTAHRVLVTTFELPAEDRAVPTARGWISAFAGEHGADRATRGRIALAFNEAFTNAVRHAYPDSDGGDVRVSVDVDDASLEIVVTDDGCGFAPNGGVIGLGAGLGIIAQTADAFAIRERQPSGLEVWLRFELGRG